MAMDYRADSPRILLEFLSYHETVKAHSQKTVDEYYLDLHRWFLDLPDTLFLRSATLYHHHWHPVRKAAFQNGSISFDAFRERNSIK